MANPERPWCSLATASGQLQSFANTDRGTIVIEDLEIGMMRSLMKEITDLDIELFAQVSTDRNPVHLDDDYANDTIFQGRIAHGMLVLVVILQVLVFRWRRWL